MNKINNRRLTATTGLVTMLVTAGLSGKDKFFTYFQIKYSTPQAQEGVVQSEFVKAMSVQMKYVFPILMVFIAYTISSAIALIAMMIVWKVDKMKSII